MLYLCSCLDTKFYIIALNASFVNVIILFNQIHTLVIMKSSVNATFPWFLINVIIEISFEQVEVERVYGLVVMKDTSRFESSIRDFIQFFQGGLTPSDLFQATTIFEVLDLSLLIHNMIFHKGCLSQRNNKTRKKFRISFLNQKFN